MGDDDGFSDDGDALDGYVQPADTEEQVFKQGKQREQQSRETCKSSFRTYTYFCVLRVYIFVASGSSTKHVTFAEEVNPE